jgi:hypothetical protein
MSLRRKPWQRWASPISALANGLQLERSFFSGGKVRVTAVVYGLFLLLVLAPSSLAQSSWKNEWERVVKAATEEGRLNAYGVTVFEEVFKYFQKEYPEIKLSFVVGRGAGIAPRLMQERRAGKFTRAFLSLSGTAGGKRSASLWPGRASTSSSLPTTAVTRPTFRRTRAI